MSLHARNTSFDLVLNAHGRGKASSYDLNVSRHRLNHCLPSQTPLVSKRKNRFRLGRSVGVGDLVVAAALSAQERPIDARGEGVDFSGSSGRVPIGRLPGLSLLGFPCCLVF